MDLQIEKLIKKSLSNTDILKLINGKANLVSYPDVKKYKTLDKLLGKYKACVILYETKPNYGHWCCIFLNNNLCEFFDPYSIFPDKQLKNINDKYRIVSNQDKPYLTKLMINSPYQLSYNHHQFQQYKKNINTCGRWVALRLIFRYLDLDTFIDIFGKNKKIPNDIIATLLTYHI